MLRKAGGGGEPRIPLELGCPHGNRSRRNLREERWEEQPLLALLPEEASHSGPQCPHLSSGTLDELISKIPPCVDLLGI